MKILMIILLAMSTASLAQQREWRKVKAKDVTGTWKLLSYKEPRDSLFRRLEVGKECIKMNTDTHYSFAYYNPKEKTFDMAGGGRYTLIDGRYTEITEYFSLNPKLAGKSFTFELTINGDSLFQKSTEPQGLQEYWIRVKE
jgi:hypothetical protein